MKNYLACFVTVIGIAAAAPALAQTSQPSKPMAQGQQQGQQNEAMRGRRAVIGEVVEIRDIQLKGVSDKHRLVKIKNAQGNTLVVNVGNAARTPMKGVKKGSRIVAIGKEARINGNPVLYARYVGQLSETGSVGKVAQR